jgi:hypothetical protein
MSTTHTRATRLLVTAIGAAVVGISLAAAPAALADQSAPNPPGNTVPLPSGGSLPPPPPAPPPHYVVVTPPPPHIPYTLPPNKTQSGWK